MEFAKVTCSRELGRYLLAHPTSVGDLFAAPLWNDRFRELFREMQQVPVDGFDRPCGWCTVCPMRRCRFR